MILRDDNLRHIHTVMNKLFKRYVPDPYFFDRDEKKLKRIKYALKKDYPEDTVAIGFIDRLISSMPSYRRAISLEDPEIELLVTSHFELMISEYYTKKYNEKGEQVKLHNELHGNVFKLADYFPIIAYYNNLKKGEVEAVHIFHPTHEEKKLILELDNEDIRTLLDRLVQRNLKVDLETNTLTLGRYTYKTSRNLIVAYANRYGLTQPLIKRIKKEIEDYLPFNLKKEHLGNKILIFTTLREVSSYRAPNPKVEITIIPDLSAYPFVWVEMKAIDYPKQVTLEDYINIRELRDGIRVLANKMNEYFKRIDHVESFAQARGYEVIWQPYRLRRGEYPGFLLTDSYGVSVAPGAVSTSIHIGVMPDRCIASATVSRVLKIPDVDEWTVWREVKPELEKIGVNAVSAEKRRGEVTKIVISLVVKDWSSYDIIEKVERAKTIIIKEIKRQENLIQYARDTLSNFSHYVIAVTGYILSGLDSFFDPTLEVGYPKSRVHRTIGKLLAHLGAKTPIDTIHYENHDEVLKRLILSGYIKLDNDRIFIGDVEFSSVLEKLPYLPDTQKEALLKKAKEYLTRLALEAEKELKLDPTETYKRLLQNPKEAVAVWNTYTRNLAVNYPNTISLSNKQLPLEIKEHSFTAIQTPKYLIQVAQYADHTRYAPKLFIVYDNKTGIGIPIQAKTIEQATTIADKLQKQIQTELTTLEKDKTIKISPIQIYGKYTLLKLQVKTRQQHYEFLYRPGIMESVKKLQRKQHMKQVENTFS